ncbi:MAG: hypothetical protein V4736_13740 [Bdellovibrionota bacterium]
MKWIISILLIAFTAGAIACPPAKTPPFAPFERSISDIRNLRPSDRPVPFPWGKESEFPWDQVEGTWVVKDKDFETLYTIRVLKDNATKTRKIFTNQYDVETCKKIAIGQGIVDRKTAWVRMAGQDKVPFYSLGLRAFAESTVQALWEYQIKADEQTGQVVVFSIAPYALARTQFNLTAERISRKTEIVCD